MEGVPEPTLQQPTDAVLRTVATCVCGSDLWAYHGVDSVEGAHADQPTGGVGADAALACVGTNEAMQQALRSTRPGGSVGFVGVPHGVQVRAWSCSPPTPGSAAGRRPSRGSCPTSPTGCWTAAWTRAGSST